MMAEKQEQERKMSLVAKLAEACDAVGGIEKKGTNELQRYKYVKAADVAKAIRHELFSRGVVIMADEKEFVKTGDIPTKSGGMLREFTLKVEYTILDSESDAKIVSTAYGVAMDSGDKALYKCKTGAIKYFLRGLGLIPDEKDDPEADESVDRELTGKDKHGKTTEDYERAFDERDSYVAKFQVDAFWAAAKKTGKSDAMISEFLKRQWDIVQVEQIKKADFNEAIRWASTVQPVPADLTAPLQKTLELVKSPIPAPEWKRFWALAKAHNITDPDVHRYALERYGVSSLKQLSVDQFNEVAQWVSLQEA